MGQGEKKEYRDLQGKPVIIHSLISFLSTSYFTELVITIPAGDGPRLNELLKRLPAELLHSLQKIKLVEGGATRQDSVRHGLEAIECNPRIVLIHDAARPWVSTRLIQDIVQSADTYGACIPVVPSTDAMKQIDTDGLIHSHLDRFQTVCAQTPQGFGYPDILTAHKKAAGDGNFYIDDSEIYSRYIGEVHTVEGHRDNIKITFPSDFYYKNEEHT